MTRTFLLKRKRNEYGKKIRKAYESHQIKERMLNIRDWVLVPQNHSNSLTGVQLDNLIMTTDQLPLLPQEKSPTTTSSLEASPVNLFQSLENVEALMTPEELFSLTSQGYSKIRKLNTLSSKMLKDCFLTTTEKLSEPLSVHLLSWGMTSNGKCLTARISESPRIGKECSLSDILEENPDPKYFLSEAMTQYILNKKHHKVAISTVPSEAKETNQ